MQVVVRAATVTDAAALAALRWRRQTEERGYAGTDRAGFQHDPRWLRWLRD